MAARRAPPIPFPGLPHPTPEDGDAVALLVVGPQLLGHLLVVQPPVVRVLRGCGWWESSVVVAVAVAEAGAERGVVPWGMGR